MSGTPFEDAAIEPAGAVPGEPHATHPPRVGVVLAAGRSELKGAFIGLPCGVKKLDRERKPERFCGSVGARPLRSPDLIDEKRTAGTSQ